MDAYLREELAVIATKIASGDLVGNDFIAEDAKEKAYERQRKRKKKAKKQLRKLQQEMDDTF